VKEEAKPFRRFAGGRPDVRILLTGMGRRNAERALRAELDSARPQRVLSAGFAGGLNPELASGAVLFGTDAPPELARLLAGAGARPGGLHCAERVAATVGEKLALRQQTGADAVEMESGVLCACCRELGLPAATVRVILDPANEDLPLDFNRVLTAEQRLDGRKLALALARAPGKIPALLRLQRQSAAAAERLASVLEKVLKAT
jgi:adenosylhomocysteine nucleosidase